MFEDVPEGYCLHDSTSGVCEQCLGKERRYKGYHSKNPTFMGWKEGNLIVRDGSYYIDTKENLFEVDFESVYPI